MRERFLEQIFICCFWGGFDKLTDNKQRKPDMFWGDTELSFVLNEVTSLNSQVSIRNWVKRWCNTFFIQSFPLKSNDWPVVYKCCLFTWVLTAASCGVILTCWFLSFNDGLRLIPCVLYSLLSPVVNFDRVKSEGTITRRVLHRSIHASHQLRYSLDQGCQTHFTFWATYSSIWYQVGQTSKTIG